MSRTVDAIELAQNIRECLETQCVSYALDDDMDRRNCATTIAQYLLDRLLIDAKPRPIRMAPRADGMTPNRRFREITARDVGIPTFRAFGRTWSTADFIGRILPGDVGKRVYLTGDILQVENDEQRAKRREVQPRSACPSRDGMAGDPHVFKNGACVFCSQAEFQVK